jgi:hypothetical protein
MLCRSMSCLGFWRTPFSRRGLEDKTKREQDHRSILGLLDNAWMPSVENPILSASVLRLA